MGKASRRKKNKQQQSLLLTKEQSHEFLRIVRDDLVFLKSLNYKRPSRTEVRVASGVLRRMLHEGMLQGAWQIAGFEGQPKITAIDLGQVVSAVPARYIHYAYAGGAKTEGANHTGYMLMVVPKAEAEAEGHEAAAKRIGGLIKPGLQQNFVLADFCASPSVISGKAAVSRVDVVRYVANKLGGVHWDNSRGEWTNPVSSRHRLLDEEHLIVGRLPGPLYEVVSIAQAVADADDIEKLVDKIECIAPEEERSISVLSFREGRTGKYADMTFNTKGEDTDK